MRIALAFVAAALLVSSAATAAPEITIGVLPLKGRAPKPFRVDATDILEQSITGLPDVRVVSFDNVADILGQDAARRIEACLDDACVRRATSGVRTDVLVVGEVEVEETFVLRLRLLDTATTGPPRVRVTRAIEGGRSGLVQAVASAVADLFPKRSQTAQGTIVVAANRANATVHVDGKVAATTADQATEGAYRAVVKVRPGAHRVVVAADGHHPVERTADVIVGQRTVVDFALEKNRSNSPLVLGGVGAVLLGAAVVVGATTKATADEWDAACAGVRCDEGYTRARYESDADAVSRGRFVTNGLLVAGSVALVGAVVWYFVDPGETPDFAIDGEGRVVGWSW